MTEKYHSPEIIDNSLAIEIKKPQRIHLPNQEKYVLRKMINKGAFGVVYKASCQTENNKSDDDLVAVKTVRIRDVDQQKKILLEAAFQTELRNIPHVVHLIDFWVHDGRAFFVQELAMGGDLLDRCLEKERYQETEAKIVARTLISTIRELHNRGIIHRDLKPENLLLTDSNDDTKIMLCDFGDAAGFSSDEDDKHFTVCGTPAFMAPEVVSMNGYREEVDMWSIGCILFMMMGGYAPFGYDLVEAYKRASKSDYHFNCHPWNTEVSISAKKFITNLVNVDVVERWNATEALHSHWLAPETTTNSKTRERPLSLSTHCQSTGRNIRQRRK